MHTGVPGGFHVWGLIIPDNEVSHVGKEPSKLPTLPLEILAVLVTVTALLVIAGCLYPASENPPPTVPSTCSVDANVCTCCDYTFCQD